MTGFSARKKKLKREPPHLFVSILTSTGLSVDWQELNSFSAFFNHIDHFQQEEFLYVTSGGIPAAKPSLQPTGPAVAADSSNAQQEGAGKTSRISQREALAAVEPASDGEGDGEEGGWLYIFWFIVKVYYPNVCLFAQIYLKTSTAFHVLLYTPYTFLEDRIEIESYLTGSLWETDIAGWYQDIQ